MAEEWDFHENSVQDQYFETSAKKSPSLRRLEISMKLIGEDMKELSNHSFENEEFVASISDEESIPDVDVLKEDETGEQVEIVDKDGTVDEVKEDVWTKPDDSTISTQEEIGEVPSVDEKKSEFTVSLWTAEESSEVKTVESWDLPQGSVAWNDIDKPIERLLQYAELDLTDEEENGLLTDRIIAACCSYLTQTPESKEYVVAKVMLNNKNLNDIRILKYHQFLQYVDLSWNNIQDLTPLGCIPYLMYLDVSHNLLREVLRFKPPWNLTYVNYSYNEVWQIDDLSDFWALCYLDLSHNKISKIQGLQNLRFLRHLDLSHNKIESLENLNHLRITDLNLEYNLISKFENQEEAGLHTMMYLSNLYLNHNLITKLDCFKNVYHLKKLELQYNNIADVAELPNLKSLKSLRLLDLSENPVTDFKAYRNSILSILPGLQFLDQTEIDVAEKVAACKMNKPCSLKLEAARNNASMMLLDCFNKPCMDLDILPVDQGAYPLIILVGPPASSKKSLVKAISEKHKDIVQVGKLHTTKDLREGEEQVLLHLSREEFHDRIKSGKFLCVMELLGHLYAFSREELGMAVKNHKLCLTQMDMEGALTIHSYGIQPFLILCLPKSEKDHLYRLRKKFGAVEYFIGGVCIGDGEFNVQDSKTTVQDIVNYIIEEVLEITEGKRSTNSSETFMYSIETTNSPKPRSLKSVNSSVFEQQSFIGPEKSSANSSDGTSYSEAPPPPIRIRLSEFSGESDVFNDWSQPFVDWDETNASEGNLRETAERLCEKFISNVIASREVYESLHSENPGLFSLSVNSDNFDKAFNKIEAYVKEVWTSIPDQRPIFDVEKDCAFHELIPQRLKKFKEMIKMDRYSPDGDNKSNDSVSSPHSIVSQMQLLGHGDMTEKL